ncbi:MAG: class I SAM-dependent methyltransferase [Thermoleophilaceae bacterium]|nr:class I SAM-dependent methyltransferase [Thermoleophilaceae bacterium]
MLDPPLPAVERARELVATSSDDAEGDAAAPVSPGGYLDLLAGRIPDSTGRAQDLMLSGVVPRIYERWWRPALGRLAKGPLGPSMEGERRLVRELLRLEPGDGATVLDVACGTGSFTRELARVVGPAGLAVGIDVSKTMLARATAFADRAGLRNVAYVRGDAEALAFGEGSFDAVCCFAALHLFSDPMRGLDRMHAVLRPGGRLAIMTSVRRFPRSLRSVESTLGKLGGMRVFGTQELHDALRARGFEALEWQLAGVTQFVTGRRSAPAE